MLEQATKDFALDLEESWTIGDHLRDLQAGRNVGCKTIFILTGHVHSEERDYYTDFVAKNMQEAANYILDHENK